MTATQIRRRRQIALLLRLAALHVSVRLNVWANDLDPPVVDELQFSGAALADLVAYRHRVAQIAGSN